MISLSDSKLLGPLVLVSIILGGSGCKKTTFECLPDHDPATGDLTAITMYLLKSDAGRAEYSPDGSLISYHKAGADGYYDCYVMNADGTAETCLTCSNNGFPGKHAGQPSWHPSGQYLVFQAEKANYFADNISSLAHPGIGYNNDVYFMTSDGSQVWQLTDLVTKQSLLDPNPITGILHPHFSNNGNLISWAEKTDVGGDWGEWEIVIADFTIQGGTPEISNIRRFQPGEQDLYYETNDFNADDSKLIICGNLKSGQPEIGMDLYEMDVVSGELNQLTHSNDDWDESGHYSPDQQWITYIGSEGFTPPQGREWYKTGKAEFWLMQPGLNNRYPITGFNCPDSPEFRNKRVMPAYISWKNDGTGLLASIVVEEANGQLVDELWTIQLEEH